MRLFAKKEKPNEQLERAPDKVHDPDEDLASNAGFEVHEKKQGFIMSFFQPRGEAPALTVKEVEQSKPQQDTTLDDNDGSISEKGSHDKYLVDHANNSILDSRGREGGCCAAFCIKTKDLFRDDNGKRGRWTSPFALLIYFLLLLALFLGIILGLKDRGGNDNTTTTGNDGPPGPSIQILIDFDANPEQLGWAVLDQDNWEVIVEKKRGSYDASSPSVNEKVELEWDHDYLFRIYDSGYDGLSDGEGGRYQMLYKGNVVVSCTGDWGGEDIVAFRVEEGQDLVIPDETVRCSG